MEVQQSKHNTLGPLQLLWDRLIQFKHRITLSGASFTPREIVQYGNIVIYYIVIYHMLWKPTPNVFAFAEKADVA